MRKLDIFTHIWPKRFYEALRAETGTMKDMTRRSEAIPMMTDLDERFRVMDRFPEYQQVLSLASPPLEVAVRDPQKCQAIARIGNDDMAKLCERYPERFPGFVAAVALTDMPGALKETRRVITELGACGIQIFTNVVGKPLDAPEFRDFFRLMHELDRPIWMHPARGANRSDYASEDRSLYEIWWTFGWPYESSAAQARMVFSKMLDELPRLKVIIHHAGGMVPFFEGRVGPGWDQLGARTSDTDYSVLLKELKRRPLDYFKDFYADTASFGSRAAIECALAFYGVEHILFASDSPFDPEKGSMYIRETIKVLDALDIPEADRASIYHGNACRLLGWPN
jgi:predicted TIM-barrel fold metal-dependent hydrolase